jgi:hypothetical protein
LLLHHTHHNAENNIDDCLLQQVEESVNKNKKMWNEIHDSIITTSLEQLTLLSKHTINLNSFNLSADGDTYLHSAAKSNNVKTIEFVLQSISPSTKQLMLKMKNYRGQLPPDLLRRWAHTFAVSAEIQTSCGSSVDAWSKEARWNSLLPSNSLLQTTQRTSVSNSEICSLAQLTTLVFE